MKRIFLFLITNLAVMVVLSATMRILGVDRFLTAQGLNLTGLLIFSAVIGFTGAIKNFAADEQAHGQMEHRRARHRPQRAGQPA